jgi:hypothetical protein
METTTKTTEQKPTEFTFSFDDRARENLTINDQEKIRHAVLKLGAGGIAVRLTNLDIRGDIFLARTGKIKKVRIERDQKLILRLGYVDRRNQADGEGMLNFGIWMVVSSQSEAFQLY